MKKINNIKLLQKENEVMRKFIRWCRDMNFFKKNESYISTTQLSSRISNEDVNIIKKIKGMEVEK